jgi:YfiH family protein
LSPKKLITVPRLERIPFLHHGFGTASWKEKDFARRKEWQGFKLLFLDQIHSDVVHFIRKVPAKNPRGDALVTDLPGLILVIKTADCLPILLVDEANRVIAAVHCGWKGTLQRVLEKVILGMKDHFGSDARALLAGFGPCIGGNCYEVGEDIPARFAAKGFPVSFFLPIPGCRGKYLFDLREANRFQLRRVGIPEKNIFSVGICTHCDSRCLSYRRDKNQTGRMLSFIGMSP